MFHDHEVNRLNHTGNAMLCSSSIRVESLHKGLMRLGKDWTLMLQSYLILSLERFDEECMQSLPNQNHSSPLCVQCVGFGIQS